MSPLVMTCVMVTKSDMVCFCRGPKKSRTQTPVSTGVPTCTQQSTTKSPFVGKFVVGRFYRFACRKRDVPFPSLVPQESHVPRNTGQRERERCTMAATPSFLPSKDLETQIRVVLIDTTILMIVVIGFINIGKSLAPPVWLASSIQGGKLSRCSPVSPCMYSKSRAQLCADKERRWYATFYSTRELFTQGRKSETKAHVPLPFSPTP